MQDRYSWWNKKFLGISKILYFTFKRELAVDAKKPKRTQFSKDENFLGKQVTENTFYMESVSEMRVG